MVFGFRMDKREKYKEVMLMKTLVAYFSATETTGAVATELANAISADLYEIVPEALYTNEDLNWRNKSSRSSVEMENETSRPAIGSAVVEDMDQYELIFLLAPIWWYEYPRIMETFLESYELSGKKIVLIATSGSSGFGKTVEKLRPSAPGAEFEEGIVLHSSRNVKKAIAVAEKYL